MLENGEFSYFFRIFVCFLGDKIIQIKGLKNKALHKIIMIEEVEKKRK